MTNVRHRLHERMQLKHHHTNQKHFNKRQANEKLKYKSQTPNKCAVSIYCASRASAPPRAAREAIQERKETPPGPKFHQFSDCIKISKISQFSPP